MKETNLRDYYPYYTTDRFVEVQEALHLSVTTVRYHVNNLITKTGFSSRTELAVNAVKSGIAIPGLK